MKTKGIYGIREGYSLPEKEAPRLGKAWEALERKLQRPPTAHDLVEAAADPKSAFHTFIEWDEGKAAYEYRLTQARYLIRSLAITLPEFGDMKVRAIISVDGENDPIGGFMSTATAVSTRPDIVRNHLRRLHLAAENIEREYGAWASFIEFEPGREFVKAATKLARAKI